MKFTRVNYNHLSSRQKENYNYHKIASALAEFGYNSMWLNDDWEGADFIAIHIGGSEMLKVQLKGRFTIHRKYIGKDIKIAYIEKGTVKFYDHDEAVTACDSNIMESRSWIEQRLYSWNQTPKKFDQIITILNS